MSVLSKSTGDVLNASDIQLLNRSHWWINSTLSTSNLYGDGSDGALSVAAGTTTAYGIKHYTAVTINGGVLEKTQDGHPLYIFCQGNCTLSTSGTAIYFKGRGWSGGQAGREAPTANSVCLDAVPRGEDGHPHGTIFGLWGGKGGNHGLTTVGNSGSYGAGGSMSSVFLYSNYADSPFMIVPCGTGGGAGGNSQAGGSLRASVAGGNGGGSLALFVGGNLTISTSTTCNFSGANGDYAATGAAESWGGGGSGGVFWAKVAGTITNNGTITVAAGTGGTSGGATGDGDAGVSIVESI